MSAMKQPLGSLPPDAWNGLADENVHGRGTFTWSTIREHIPSGIYLGNGKTKVWVESLADGWAFRMGRSGDVNINSIYMNESTSTSSIYVVVNSVMKVE